MLRRSAIAVLPLLWGAGIQPAAWADEALNGSAIRALFPGQFEGRFRGMLKVNVNMRSDGTALGSLLGKTDEGRWIVRGRALCIAWTQWTDGKFECHGIRREGEWFVSDSASLKLRKF